MKDRSSETKEDDAYEYPKTGDSEFVLSKAITGVNPKGAWLFGDGVRRCGFMSLARLSLI